MKEINRANKPINYAELGDILDGCNAKKGDDILDKAGNSTESMYKQRVAGAIHEWASDDIELVGAETYGDRLYALLVGMADLDGNDEIDDDEAEFFSEICDMAISYLLNNGVNEDDAVSLVEDFDNDVAENVRDLLIGNLDDGDIDSFAFDTDKDNEILDAVYKKMTAIRGGRKVRLNKRISGTVRLSGAQKAAIKKAGRRAHNAGANMKRMKSMRLRGKMNIKPMVHK